MHNITVKTPAYATYTGWPKKVSHHQFFQKIVLKIVSFLRKVKV